MSNFTDPAPEELRRLFEETRVIAVVGLSDKAFRTSYRVASYLQEQGYRIIPVNPLIASALGEKAYPSLRDVKEKVDLVDIFRRSAVVAPVVDDAIAIGAKAIWMQQDIIHHDAARKAKAAGLKVIMDRCLMVDHYRVMRS